LLHAVEGAIKRALFTFEVTKFSAPDPLFVRREGARGNENECMGGKNGGHRGGERGKGGRDNREEGMAG